MESTFLHHVHPIRKSALLLDTNPQEQQQQQQQQQQHEQSYHEIVTQQQHQEHPEHQQLQQQQKRLHTGRFTDEETAIIKTAINEYCARKKISIGRLCSECNHKSELKGAWMEISKRVPNRSVQSVYRHGIRQCHPFKRGSWTVSEQDQLLALVSSIGKKWSVIQVKLNRSADSCRDKYRELSDEYTKGRWNIAETITLIESVCQYIVNPTSSMYYNKNSNHRSSIQLPDESTAKQIKILAKSILNDISSCWSSAVTPATTAIQVDNTDRGHNNCNNNKNDIEPNEDDSNINNKTPLVLFFNNTALESSIQELGRLLLTETQKSTSSPTTSTSATMQIPWSTISKKMGKRSRLSCFKKWQKLTNTNTSTSTTINNTDSDNDVIMIPEQLPPPLLTTTDPMDIPTDDDRMENDDNGGGRTNHAINATIGDSTIIPGTTDNERHDHNHPIDTAICSKGDSVVEENTITAVTAIIDEQNMASQVIDAALGITVLTTIANTFLNANVNSIRTVPVRRRVRQQYQEDIDDNATVMPVMNVVSDNNVERDLADLAAETVEAVNLPDTNTLRVPV